MSSVSRIFALAGALAALAILAVAFAAANSVPATTVGQIQVPIGANDLKPPECAGITLTTVVAGVNGTNGNDLVLGTAAGETVKGNGGDDCLVAGGGNDALTAAPEPTCASAGPAPTRSVPAAPNRARLTPPEPSPRPERAAAGSAV